MKKPPTRHWGFFYCDWASGNFLWAFQLRNIASCWQSEGRSIAFDANANVVIGGTFTGTADFDPGAGTDTVSAGPIGGAAFIAKYNPAGNFISAFDFAAGMNTGISPTSIATDLSGNILVTGSFFNTADFDPGAGTSNLLCNGGQNFFVAEYDSAGNYIRAFSVDATNYNQGNSFAVDAAGNISVTGIFNGTSDFDPGAGTSNLTSVGYHDAFLACYDVSGNYRWAFSLGCPGNNYPTDGTSVSNDNFGSVYVFGSFNGTNLDFDPGAGTHDLSSSQGTGTDLFFGKYDGITGSKEFDLENSIHIYPNPSNGKFFIDSDAALGKIEIYDEAGKTIYRSKISDTKTEIDLRGLESGIYFIRSLSEKNVRVEKLIVQ